MTLDPQAQSLLSAMEQQGMKDFADGTVDEARTVGLAFIDLEGPREDVAQMEQRTIPSPSGPISVRIYRPSNAGDQRAAVVYFHGGGWVMGNLEIADKPCRSLANASGVTVISADYRKAPEYTFPAAPDDCYTVTAWVAAHADELGIDPSRIAVAGDSAGGNLAAVVTLMAKERGGPDIAHQLLIYPAVDAGGDYPSRTENGVGYLLTDRAMSWFYSHYLPSPGQAAQPFVSPIRGDLAGLPPATVITAGFDPLRDEGAAYVRALTDAGVAVEHLHQPSMIHGFFWMMGVLDHTRDVYTEAGSKLRLALAG